MTIRKLHVDAQLDVEIDGQPAQLVGQGDRLQLVLGREETLPRLLDGNRAAAPLADRLADLGLTLTVVDQGRPLVNLGSGVSSRVGRLFTGSRHIAPASVPALVTLLRGYLGR